jgi:hypothetical protein
MLTSSQLTAIAAHIAASADMNTQPADEPGALVIANLLNAPAAPNYWVFRTKVTEEEIVGQPSQDSTLFSWSTFIQRSQGERDGWMRLFRSGQVNPSLSNVQAAIKDIFSGTGAAPVAQRLHIDTVFRRKATRLEKLLATGAVVDGNQPGTTLNPATPGFEGNITIGEVQEARA